jgi:hypothetical protein
MFVIPIVWSTSPFIFEWFYMWSRQLKLRGSHLTTVCASTPLMNIGIGKMPSDSINVIIFPMYVCPDITCFLYNSNPTLGVSSVTCISTKTVDEKTMLINSATAIYDQLKLYYHYYKPLSTYYYHYFYYCYYIFAYP